MDKYEQDKHILKNFDADLQQLRNGLLQLGGLVEQQLLACESLLDGGNGADDWVPMQAVRERENRINRLDLQISEDLINCLSVHQPMAKDARACASYVRIGLDLERMGDELGHVAEAFVELKGNAILQGEPGQKCSRLLKMCKAAVARALNVLDNLDAGEAQVVIDRDREINDLQMNLQRQLEAALEQRDTPVASAITLIRATRSLERVGDHAKNLAQAVIYAVTGEDPRTSEVRHKAKQAAKPQDS